MKSDIQHTLLDLYLIKCVYVCSKAVVYYTNSLRCRGLYQTCVAACPLQHTQVWHNLLCKISGGNLSYVWACKQCCKYDVTVTSVVKALNSVVWMLITRIAMCDRKGISHEKVILLVFFREPLPIKGIRLKTNLILWCMVAIPLADSTKIWSVVTMYSTWQTNMHSSCQR